MRRAISTATLSIFLVGCASHTADPVTEPEVVNARVGAPETPIARGDCAEALRRALAKPDLDVEKVPAPLAMRPVAIDTKKMPKGVVEKNKYTEIRVQVVVDTFGKPDMRTFTVVKSTHPWLTTSVKNALAKWIFSPAEVAGCRVPRVYNFVATSGKAPGLPAGRAAAKKPPV